MLFLSTILIPPLTRSLSGSGRMRLPFSSRQRVEMLCYLGLDVRETVIPLRSHKDQPQGDHLAKAQFTLPVTMGRKERIEKGRNLHFALAPTTLGCRRLVRPDQADNLVNHRPRLPDVFNSQKSLLV
jgi:hypothetical protein